MKTPQEIIERAQIQLILKDRLIWEDGYSEGRFHTMEERRKQQELESSWISFRALDKAMSPEDLHLLHQKIETVESSIQAQRSFECEAIEPLLWACTLVDKLTPVSRFMMFDFHPLLTATPLADVCQAAVLRDEAQLSAQRDIFMLWYWRCRINQRFEAAKGKTVVDAISGTFTAQEVVCAKKIKRVQGDFAVGRRPFSQLTPRERYMMELCMQWRYHALAWVLNDESWYDTSTDT
jgi:hypothetical protein